MEKSHTERFAAHVKKRYERAKRVPPQGGVGSHRSKNAHIHTHAYTYTTKGLRDIVEKANKNRRDHEMKEAKPKLRNRGVLKIENAQARRTESHIQTSTSERRAGFRVGLELCSVELSASSMEMRN